MLNAAMIFSIASQELNDIARANAKAGLISDSELEKSLDYQEKTFPNGINPCGADALRLTLASYDIEGIFYSNNHTLHLYSPFA